MFSVEGVKYTTARRVAEDVVDRVVAAVAVRVDRCRTQDTRVDEAEVADLPLDAQARLAVRDEMAVRLADVILRRIGTGADRETVETVETVATVARVAGAELGWSAQRREAEIEDVMRQIRTNGSSGSLA